LPFLGSGGFSPGPATGSFDILVVPFLLWRRTRLVAFLVAVGFHLINMQLFDIGVFPWFSMATTTLFFPPDWPRRLVMWWRGVPEAGRKRAARPEAPRTTTGLRTGQKVTVALLGVVLIIQVLLPLRRHLYPGNFLWTEEGYMFSWDMIVSTKSGEAEFEVKDRASGKTWVVAPRRYLSPPQERMMMRRPSRSVTSWRANGARGDTRTSRSGREVESRSTTGRRSGWSILTSIWRRKG
jgi:vitamin K-dependent gamma-carboxylase